jgi:predicted nucleic acid-binding protein
MSAPVVVDTNVVFSALLKRQSQVRQTLFTAQRQFISPRFIVVELFKRKERIARLSELTHDELLEQLNATINRLTFVDESAIGIGAWIEGRRLCRDIDLKDTPFVALALHAGAELWTQDEPLKAGLRRNGFEHFFIS